MENQLLRAAYQHPLLTEADLQDLFAVHKRIEYPKGAMLLQKGDIANEYFIAEQGLVRSYLYDYEGNEITTGFAGPGDVVIEVASIFQRVPTEDYIQCVTDCVLWQIDFEQFQNLFHQSPAIREWGRAWMALELYRHKMRATEIITLPAAKRYMQLLERRPEVLQLAPLKYIASYLGVTDTSLSRIRKELSSGLGH